MNIKAFRQDLAQKAQEARKTYLSEDKINVTYSGIKAQTELEKYQSLAEKLELDVQDIVNVINETKDIPNKIRLRPRTSSGSGAKYGKYEPKSKPKPNSVSDDDKKKTKLEEVAYQLFAIKEAATSGYSDSWSKSFISNANRPEKTEDSISSMRKKAEEIGGIPQPSAEEEELAKMRETASRKGGMPDASSAQPQSAKEPQQTFSPKPMDMVIRDARDDGMTQVRFAKKMQDFENSRKTSKPSSSMPYSQRAPEETEAEPEQTSTGPESSYATSQRADLFKGMVQNALDKTRSSSEFNPEPSSVQSSAAQLLNAPASQAKEKNYSPMPVEQRLRQAMTSGRKPAPKFDYSASTAQRTQNLLNSMNAKKK